MPFDHPNPDHPTPDSPILALELSQPSAELLQLLRSPDITPENFIRTHKELVIGVLTGELGPGRAEAAVRILEGALPHVMMIEKRASTTPGNQINVLVQNMLGAQPLDSLADMRNHQLVGTEE